MSTKTLIMLSMTVGSVVGGYVPVLFGVSAFSYFSVITSGIGGIVGIIIGLKMFNS